MVFVVRDTADNLVPSSILKIDKATFNIIGGAPLDLEVTRDDEDRGFRVNPFQIKNGWSLKADHTKTVKISVRLERNGEKLSLEQKLDATFFSGLPSKITIEGGCFEKLLSREQFVTTKLKLTDAWGNPFRGLDNFLDAEVSVDQQSWLYGSSAGGPLLPLTHVKEGFVHVDPKNLSVYLAGKYGMKESITFACTMIDHRFDPALRFQRIEVAQAFEVEDLELQFCVPASISEKFRTTIVDGCCVIEVDYGSSDVQRRSLHGIYLQILKKGSSKAYTGHRKEQRILCERHWVDEAGDSADDDEDDSGIYEFSLDLKEGRSAPIDKHLQTDASHTFKARFDELQAEMRVLVKAGKPARIEFEPVDAVEVGCSVEVSFSVMDERGLALRDLSAYSFEVQPEMQLTGLFVQTTGPVRRRGGGHRLECTVTGALPDNSSGQYLLRLLARLAPAASRSAGPDDMADSGSGAPVTECFAVTVHPGAARSLRLVARNGSHFDALGQRLDIVSGTKLEFVVQAVDAYGNVDPGCKRRVRLTATGDSEGDEPCSSSVLALVRGEAELTIGPWFARGTGGTLSAEAADRAQPRLEAARHDLRIRAGRWPAQLRLLSPPGAEAGGVTELDDAAERLDAIEAEVLAADGSIYTHSRLVVLLRQEGSADSALQESVAGPYRLEQVAIPREPGEYLLRLVVGSPGGARLSIPPRELRVRRTYGGSATRSPHPSPPPPPPPPPQSRTNSSPHRRHPSPGKKTEAGLAAGAGVVPRVGWGGRG